MSIRIYGENPVFGVQEPRKITGLPPGKVRLRMRAQTFAVAYVKQPNGIRAFYLRHAGDQWEASFEMGRNLTLPKPDREPVVAIAEYEDGTREEIRGA